MKAIEAINHVITAMLKYACMVLAAALAIVIFLQIMMRLFFQPLLWSEEASRIMMVWLVFLGAAYLYNLPKNGHIKVDLLEQVIPIGIRKYLNGLIKLVMVFILIITAKAGFELSAASMKITSTALDIPYSFIYGAIPVSAVLMLWYSLYQFLHWLDGRRRRHDILERKEGGAK